MALLGIRPLVGFADINHFQYSDSGVFEFNQGAQVTLYFQLVDNSVLKPIKGWVPSGLRYCPSATATIQVAVQNIDNSKKFTRFASIVNVNDTSIWGLSILSTDLIGNTASMQLTLVDGGVTTVFNSGPVIRTGATNCSLNFP